MTTQEIPRQTIDSIELEPNSHSGSNIYPHDSGEDNQSHSRATLFKIASAGLSFFCAGMNDGSLGTLIPHIISSYDITTDLVSIV